MARRDRSSRFARRLAAGELPAEVDCFVCGARIPVWQAHHGLVCRPCAPAARRICDRLAADWQDGMLEWTAAEWAAYDRSSGGRLR